MVGRLQVGTSRRPCRALVFDDEAGSKGLCPWLSPVAPLGLPLAFHPPRSWGSPWRLRAAPLGPLFEEALQRALFVGVEGLAPDAVAAAAGGVDTAAAAVAGGGFVDFMFPVLKLEQVAGKGA